VASLLTGFNANPNLALTKVILSGNEIDVREDLYRHLVVKMVLLCGAYRWVVFNLEQDGDALDGVLRQVTR